MLRYRKRELQTGWIDSAGVKAKEEDNPKNSTENR